MFKKLDEVSSKVSIDNILSIELSIFFHDIIYFPTENNNEKV